VKCQVCKAEIEKRVGTKFCSGKCRQKAYRQKSKGSVLKMNMETNLCPGCGMEIFKPGYCSNACKQKSYRSCARYLA